MTDQNPVLETIDDVTDQHDLQSHERTFEAFVRIMAWGALHVLLVTGYLTFVFAMGMNWLTALAILFVGGLVLGRVIGLSGAWAIAMVGQAFVVVFVRLLIALFNLVS